MQTITVCAVKEAQHSFQYECRLCSDALWVKRAEQPTRHFRNLFTARTDGLAAWENQLLKWENVRTKAKLCFCPFETLLKKQSMNCRSKRVLPFFRQLSAWVPSLCDSIKAQTALHYVSTTVCCCFCLRFRPDNTHWIIQFQALQESQTQDKYESLIENVYLCVYADVEARNVELLQSESIGNRVASLQ